MHASFGPAGDNFFEWFSVTHPVWARELARRLEKIQATCKTAEATP